MTEPETLRGAARILAKAHGHTDGAAVEWTVEPDGPLSENRWRIRGDLVEAVPGGWPMFVTIGNGEKWRTEALAAELRADAESLITDMVLGVPGSDKANNDG